MQFETLSKDMFRYMMNLLTLPANLGPRRLLRAGWRRLGPSPLNLPNHSSLRRRVDVIVICPSYPSAELPYGGQFVQVRVRAYKKAGLSVVVVVSRPETADSTLEMSNNVPVLRTTPLGLSRYLKRSVGRRAVLHHPEAENWAALSHHLSTVRPLAVFHGYEARPWRILESSYTSEELEEMAPKLDARDVVRRQTLARIFSTSDVTPIFVSDYLCKTAEEFCGQSAPQQSRIIHNPVDLDSFPPRSKQAEDRYNVLWLRSFQSHNYANDLARDAVLHLRARKDFARFRISVQGDGALWDKITKPLRNFPNIKLTRGVVNHAQVSALHAKHGVALVPSRWESQGLTLCEAMGSGLVPVTTCVAAVPEFVSDAEGRICAPDDPEALAHAIGTLADNPELFLRLSENAARRASRQCGLDATVSKEIELLLS